MGCKSRNGVKTHKDISTFFSWSKWFILSTLISFVEITFSKNCPHGTFERTPGVRLPSKGEIGPVEYFPETSPTSCYSKCLANVHCRGYFFHYGDLKCVLIGEDSWSASELLEHNSSWSYHRKVCLAGKSCRRQWAFDRIPGVQLFGYDDKRLSGIQSRDICLEKCSEEDSFVCRSARYDRVNGTCILSRHDRRTAPEAFRNSLLQVDYLENQCVEEPVRCLFHPQRSHLLVPEVHVQVNPAPSRGECELACVRHTDFTCRSFEFDPDSKRCLLSPDDSHSAPERVFYGASRYFYERGSCIEVRMDCEATSMTAVVKVTTPFRGRLYALGHPYECYAVSIRANGEVALTMPFHGRTCGTKNLGNGTFVNSVVVQHHPFVLRSTDRRIDVACDYHEVQRKLRGGKQVLEGDLQTLSQVITGLAAAPPVLLRVVNADGLEVQGVELGEQLFLKVEMLDESVFGIFGSNLFLRNGRGTETVLLIDEEGCPVEPEIFPALSNADGSKSLFSAFKAFRFASESEVKFQLTVSFCLDVCAPATCGDKSVEGKFYSFGRRKRSNNVELRTGDVVTDITMETPLIAVRRAGPLAASSDPVTEGFVKTSRGREQSVCLTRPVLYTVVVVGSLLQLTPFACCLFLFLRKRSATNYLRRECPSRQEICPKS